MSWWVEHWQDLAVAATVGTAAILWRMSHFLHRTEGRRGLANRYSLESKNFRDLEKLCLDSFEKLKRRDTLVIPVIHDISFDFSPRDYQRQYLTVEEACAIMAQMGAANSSIDIDIILHTLGGDALAAEMVADAIRSHRGKTRAHVPYIAMSAGTMIALAADELYMGRSATLGPVDTQYYGLPAHAWQHLMSGGDSKDPSKRPIRDDLMFMLAYLAKKRGEAEEKKSVNLLNKKYKSKGLDIIGKLTDPSHHGERFTVHRVKHDLGVDVLTPVRGDICKFVDLRLRMLELFPRRERDEGSEIGAARSPMRVPADGKFRPPRSLV